MNVIEQHIELTDDVLTIPVPVEWKGKGATFKLVLDEVVETIPIKKPKVDLTQFGGKFAHLPLEERLKMQKELDDMLDEWKRPPSYFIDRTYEG